MALVRFAEQLGGGRDCGRAACRRAARVIWMLTGQASSTLRTISSASLAASSARLRSVMSRRVTTKPPSRVGQFETKNQSPSVCWNSCWRNSRRSLRPLGQPFVDLAGGNRKLVALGGHAQEVEPVHAGNQHVRADGVHLAVAAVGQDQAIVLVVERKAFGQRFDRVDQPVIGLPGLLLGDDHVGDVGGVGDDHLPALEVDQARRRWSPRRYCRRRRTCARGNRRCGRCPARCAISVSRSSGST